MKKTVLILTFALVTLHSGFWPDFSFAYNRGDSDNIDKNFVRDDSKQVVLDQKDQKIYYDAKPSEKMSYANAVKYCKTMDYLGYTAWRVPSKEEMRSLLELSRRKITVKHAFKNVQQGIYWASTTNRHGDAWYFDFDLGRYSTADKSKQFYVLCVGEKK